MLRIHACHAGIVMFAVGVGKAVEEELRAIASEPVEQHFSYSADFTTMTHLVENFKLNICPGGCPGGAQLQVGVALLSLQSQWGGFCLCHPASCTSGLGWCEPRLPLALTVMPGSELPGLAGMQSGKKE